MDSFIDEEVLLKTKNELRRTLRKQRREQDAQAACRLRRFAAESSQ